MFAQKLDSRIMVKLKEKMKGKMREQAIRNELSSLRKSTSLTLNAAAQVFAQKRGFSMARYLNEKDRKTLDSVKVIEKKLISYKPHKKQHLIEIAKYSTENKWLKKHIEEINRAYTFGCYTATFILCRKVLENLLIYNILRRKYPEKKRQHKGVYYDFDKRRFLDFENILRNLRKSSGDFDSEKKLVERICSKSDVFKETANDMTHSLYHIATKREIDEKEFQGILDLIKELESKL